VTQKSWDQYYLKAINMSYSQNFESLHLHAQIIFYLISKFTGIIKLTGHLKNKNQHGPDLPELGRIGHIQPRCTTPSAAAAPFEPASRARPSAAAEYRNGIGRLRPFDQNEDQRRWAVVSLASRVRRTLTLATGIDGAELT
jgi:hypothetical protein